MSKIQIFNGEWLQFLSEFGRFWSNEQEEATGGTQVPGDCGTHNVGLNDAQPDDTHTTSDSLPSGDPSGPEFSTVRALLSRVSWLKAGMGAACLTLPVPVSRRKRPRSRSAEKSRSIKAIPC